MPLQATSGAASYDAFGGGVPVVPNYIEDVFSTWLYAGNGSTQTITNGIDLAGKGGMNITRPRNVAAGWSAADSARGFSNVLNTNGAFAQYVDANGITSVNSTGFAVGVSNGYNGSGYSIASWTFRKQPKFFDVVTYTGSGANRTIAHSLGSVPGCIIVKRTDASADWQVYHRSLANTQYMVLNSTAVAATGATRWNSTTPTSTVFSVGTDATVNASGGTYVAYIYAHDAGGFGLTGTDNVISCGITDSGGNATLGYEPQWILARYTGGADNWILIDTMRGWRNGSTDNYLFANSSNAEGTNGGLGHPTATGFTLDGGTYIYIAIRRGPMKVPTDGTKVFSPNAITNDTVYTTTGFPVDLVIDPNRSGNAANSPFIDRLRGGVFSSSANTNAEASTGVTNTFQSNTSVKPELWGVGISTVLWNFQRAPGFFDEVCYTGTGSATTQAHNLAAVPELMIVKSRSSGGGGYEWTVYSSGLTSAAEYLILNTTAAQNTGASTWNSTAPTASVFSVGASSRTNGSSVTYVNYLFATCPGVSKVFSFTGNGSTQTIDCGFTGGARFVLLKASSATGGWYVYDTARGMTVLTDPYLQLNSTAAETATLGSVTTVSTGFAVNEAITTGVNTNGVTYIGLAIA